MKQPNSLVQISVNDVNLDSLSECAGQILAKEEAVLVIGGHLQHSSLLERQKIYQAPEPRLLLLLEGEADLCVNLQDSHFEKGSIALVASDTIFEMKHISDDARVAVVIFRKDNEEIEDTFLSASPEEFERVVHLIMLLRDFMRVSPYRRRTVRSLLQTLVADVQEIRDGQIPDGPEREARPRELFAEFKRLVHKHCARERNIPFYAAQLHVSPHHLSAVIKKTGGNSVMFWVNRATVQAAKILLNTKGMMNYEVADRLNFPGAAAFSRFFKRETGMTPSEYRESLRKTAG